MSWADKLLFGLLSWETISKEQFTCSNCSQGNKAVWRCHDCSLGTVMCRRCMRHIHHENPFHKIQRWCGQHFCPAELWEVGAYVLIKHYSNKQYCEYLQYQALLLEETQKTRDKIEQEQLKVSYSAFSSQTSNSTAATAPPEEDVSMSDSTVVMAGTEQSITAEADGFLVLATGGEDKEYKRYLRVILESGDGNGKDYRQGSHGFVKVENAPEEPAETSSASVPQYLNMSHGGTYQTHSQNLEDGHEDGQRQNMPRRNMFYNAYVCVVYINGIHNMALVTCLCKGEDQLSIDLLVSRLILASFENIKTIFTTQVLDYFRLCNFELKASAYEYNNLLKWMTTPLALSDVLNLYHVLRCMSRLWRWLKKLKWAGYSNHNKNVRNIGLWDLVTFCVACPQDGPNGNLPENWQEDLNRFCLPPPVCDWQ